MPHHPARLRSASSSPPRGRQLASTPGPHTSSNTTRIFAPGEANHLQNAGIVFSLTQSLSQSHRFTSQSFPAANAPYLSQAYNSVFNTDPNVPRLVGNFPLLPLRTKTRGPAYALPPAPADLPAAESPDPDSESYDILDEVLALFRANTFFRNFEIQGAADRLLMYGIWFVSDCLGRIKPGASARDAGKEVMNLALDVNFAIPGDPGWPLNQVSSPRHNIDLHWLRTDASLPRCTSPPATAKTRSSSASTCPRSARSSPCGYSRGCTRTAATGGRASGG